MHLDSSGALRAEPFVRKAGAGPGLVCIHSNAACGSQWRALIFEGTGQMGPITHADPVKDAIAGFLARL